MAVNRLVGLEELYGPPQVMNIDRLNVDVAGLILRSTGQGQVYSQLYLLEYFIFFQMYFIPRAYCYDVEYFLINIAVRCRRVPVVSVVW